VTKAVPPPPAAPGGHATAAQLAQIETIIGDANFDRAMKWMVKEGWLKEGESITRLSETRAKRIINQSASWLRAIGAGGAK
jgi:hypothetical protein